MKKSRLQGHRGEASAEANDAWSAFLDLVGLAVQQGFILERQANGVAVLEHPTSGARVAVGICVESLSIEAREVLRQFLT